MLAGQLSGVGGQFSGVGRSALVLVVSSLVLAGQLSGVGRSSLVLVGQLS